MVEAEDQGYFLLACIAICISPGGGEIGGAMKVRAQTVREGPHYPSVGGAPGQECHWPVWPSISRWSGQGEGGAARQPGQDLVRTVGKPG